MNNNDYEFDGEKIDLDKLPVPSGWRVLVGKIKLKEKTAGGIIRPAETMRYTENDTSIVKVLAMGPLCFDDNKFRSANPKKPIEPWYKVGDVLLIGKFVGQTIEYIDRDNKETTLKFINDDEAIARISDLENVVI